MDREPAGVSRGTSCPPPWGHSPPPWEAFHVEWHRPLPIGATARHPRVVSRGTARSPAFRLPTRPPAAANGLGACRCFTWNGMAALAIGEPLPVTPRVVSKATVRDPALRPPTQTKWSAARPAESRRPQDPRGAVATGRLSSFVQDCLPAYTPEVVPPPGLFYRPERSPSQPQDRHQWVPYSPR